MSSPMAAYAAPPGEAGLFYDPVLRLGISWLDAPARGDPPSDAARAASLAEAVAGIVAIAAARARTPAEHLALRRAVDRALGLPDRISGDLQAPDPREGGLDDPPSICDAQTGREADRLGALMRRQAVG
ncbi:hypothetical protein [Falsiroseomonas sp. E2-1-a4]|uniref:hypothetical protein n=1 Tax=Falsiroseomonas sp. E2-1-a4 TaxID=3239299 RepID=UPI003F3E604D